jgi:alkaline phosphatase
MTRFIIAVSLLFATKCEAQSSHPTVANGHSHNDYEQSTPFWTAWKNNFGSIEADIFMYNGLLVVAHDKTQLSRQWTLDSLYLRPLARCIGMNRGHVFPDSTRRLQLMIDIKSDAVATLDKLIEKIGEYPSLINSPTLIIVISGNRPAPEFFANAPAWLRFDGELKREYPAAALEKIEMLSDNFARYSKWKGEDAMPPHEQAELKKWIDRAHGLHKKVRFWNAPDNPAAWRLLIALGVDYVNTDRVEELGQFLD